MSTGRVAQGGTSAEPRGGAHELPQFLQSVEEVLRNAAQFMAFVAEAMAIVVIAIALLWTALSMFRVLLRDRLTFKERWVPVRLRLGRWLLLALDILIAADILTTAVAPTFEQLGQLAIVVVIRVVLDYFLERQTQEEEEESRRGPTD